MAGLDYVAHEDVLPYSSSGEASPISHELFDKFLEFNPGQGKNIIPLSIWIDDWGEGGGGVDAEIQTSEFYWAIDQGRYSIQYLNDG